MGKSIYSSIIKRLSKVFVSIILLLFVSLNIFAAGEVVNLQRETERVHYENGEYIEYILELENKTSTVQENLQLTDTLFNSSGLEDLSVEVLESRGDGTSINIPSSPSEGSNLIISGITLGHTNEVLTDEVITTAEEKGYIKLKIKGKVKDNFSENIVSNGELSRASDNILEVTVDSTLSRVVYDYSATLESVESTYAPGSLVTYKLRLENNSSIDTIKGLKAENNWGNILTDILNEDGTVEANQEAFDYSNVSITAVVSGIDSSYGDIGQEGNLENIILGPNGVIEYTIIVSTKERAIGEIGTIGTSGEKLVKVYEALRNNNEKLVNALNKLSPKEPDITIIKEKTNTGKYLPGDEIEYNITITNNGEGYAYGYTLSDDLSIITTDLANDSTGSIDDSSDITLGNAFDSAIITLTEKGDNSGSSNYIEGDSQNTLNLDDDIYIGPGETLAYTIIGKTNESAIGKIDNQVSFTNGTDVNDSSIISMDPEDLNVSDITIEKTVGVTQYEPDTDVVYTIKVKNNADDKFVNNYNIIDNISDILTTQADGTQGQAFSNWTLNVVSPTTSTNGTKVGTNIAGSQTTDNINLTVDMAPGEEIIYELVAHVSVTSVGDILDNTSSGLDNVMESGNGIKSFPSQIAIRKTVDKTQYSPNEVLTYNIIIENKGKGYDVEVNIKDLLSSIKDKDGAGINNAFKSWNITSSFEGIDTNITPSGDSGLITEPLVDEDLNTTARIGAATRLIYTVQATVSGEACGKIKNIATINDELYSDKGSFAIDPDINVSISSDYPSYPKTGEDLESPFDITYTVKISNDSEAGFAKGVKIEDALSNVSTTALDGSTISNLFESWDISTNVYGDGTVLTSSSAYPLTSTTTDIDDTANITAGGYVEYIIKAKVKRDPSMDIIPYENIINTVTVTPKDKNEVIMSPINVSYTTSKKLPALRIEKSTSNLSYTLGGTVEYLLKVENIGEGYADNATISDELSNNFSEWTIEEEVPSPFVGTDADVNGNISNNTDINGTIDIAPGEIITYKITGTVKSLLSGETITNIGTVTDTQRGNTYKASAKLMLADPTGIYITKNASQYSYSPGGEINYTVTLYNTTSLPLDFGVLGYEFRDKFSEIDANLANDMGGTIADTTGSPFKKLFVSVNGGSETEITAEADYVHQPSLLAGIVESGNLIKPSEYTYKFRGILKDRVLSGEIKNEAVIEKTDGTQIAITSHEIDGSNSGSYTRNVDKSLYIPGEELTYTFTAKGNNGYLNNYSVNEDVKNIQVELLDGTTGNPFSIDDGEPQFTVERYVNGVLDGTSNSNGTVTSPVSDNENIVQTIDVSPEDTIIYKVKGTIRKDIVGAINFNGLVTEPYRHNLSIETTVEEGGYIPGEEITLKTTIENNSNGNAGNIDLQDLIDSLELELSDGTTGKLFPNGWTITAEKSGDNSQYINAGTYTDLSDINTEIGIPIGGKLIYKITGKVNELAVGATVNKVILDGDTVSANVQSLSSNLTVKKEVVSYYRNNGTSEVNGGYVPNGWIKYKITINNIGKGIADDIAVSDALASIKTTAYDDDGSTKEINAFSEWEILSYEKTGTDSQSNINLTSGTEALGSTSLGWEMDIPSMGSVTINILAHVDEGAIGDIKNTVSVDGKDYSSETSKSLVGKAVLTKKAYEEDGVTSKSRYISGEKIVYKVIVKNTGEGIISGTIKDGISSILSLVEETGSNGNNPKEASFDSFTITASKTSSNDIDNITKIGTFELNSTKENIDIDDVLIIAPGATVEFEITGITKENIMGNIVNKVTFGNISKSVTVREKSSNISLDKKVIKVGDTTIPEGTDPINYDPGDTVEYEITITNTGYGHKNNLVLNENIDEIQAKIAGNTLSEAFENYSFEVIDSGNSYIRQVGLKTVIDMDPGKENAPEVVTIKVTGKLKDNVIGEIDENIVTYNNIIAKSEKLQQKTPEITYYKSFTDSLKNEIPSKENFAPEETLFYKLVIKNTGEGYANDLSVIDKIYDLKTSQNDKAFQDGEVTVTTKIYNGTSSLEGTNDGKTYVTGDTSGSSLINTTIDLAPNSTVEFYIAGKTTAYAIGSITNKVLVEGEGNPTVESGKSDSVTTESIPSDIVGRKIAGTDPNTTDVYYTPGGDISYTLTFENNGNGPGIIYIKDIVSNLKVTGPGGEEINAFQSDYKFVLKTESGDVYCPSSSIELLSGEKIITGDLDTDIRLGENSSCSFTLTGKANVKAVGSIKNIATYNINSPAGTEVTISDTIEPTPGVVEITNVADGDIIASGEQATYTPGEQATYTLTIKNTGDGYAHNVNVEDLLSTMTGETSGDGSLGTVFSSIDNVTATPGANSSSIGTGITTNGYQGNFDIAPGESVVITLTGTVNDNILGEIINDPVVTYDGTELTAPVSLTTVLPELNIVTKISTDGSIYSENSVNYIPGEKLYYEVTLSNIGKGWDNDVKLSNLINEIKATNSDTSVGTESLAFDESSIIITLESGDNVVFDSSAHNIDATMDIAPGESIIFKIEGIVNSDIIGEIKLDSKYENSKGTITTETSNEVVATQGIGEVSIEEKIKDPNTGVFNLDESNYIPGENVTFKVFIKNTADTFAQNIEINNLLTNMEVTLADGSQGDAFSEWEIMQEGPLKSESVLTNVFTNGNDLKSEGNLAPNDEYAFIITAKVNENAVGTIENKSLLTVNGIVKDPSNTIIFTPNENEIEMIKSTDSTTYYPNGEMVYKVVIENTGNSIINDIVFEDAINSEQVLLGDGNNGDPFNSTTVQGEVVSGETTITTTHPNVSADSTTGKVTSTSFDIKIGEKITFQITATVNNNVVGDIKNVATYTVDGGTPVSSNQVTTISEESEIVLTKVVEEPTSNEYIPGEKIKYKITIENTGKGFGDNINIVDEISKIMVDTVNGSAVAFSENDWEWTKETEELPNVIPDLTSFTGKDLDIDVDIESGKTLTLYVEGTVNSQAYGDISNTVTGKNGEDDIPESTVNISSSLGKVEITNTADVGSYTPGEPVTYILTVTNNGDGYAQNVNVEDLLSTMTGEISGDGSPLGLVFKSIDTVNTTIGDNSASIGTPSTSNGYEGNFNIAPGESIVITLTGTVNDNILGEIVNDPVVTYNGTKLKAPVSLETVLPDLNIVTRISEYGHVYSETPVNYIPGETLYYEVTLSNTGEGWDNNVKLSNLINEIKADASDGTESLAFKESTIIIALESGNNVVFDSSAHNIDATMDIAPGEDIIFKIEGIVNSDIIGEIKLDSKYENSKGTITSKTSNEVLATQKNEGLSVTERIKNPDTGEFDLFESSYVPGEDVIFKVFIENPEDTFAQDIDINNDLKSMKVELADGSDGDAFSSWTIVQSEFPTNNNSVITSTITNNDNLKSTGNLASNDKYSFVITAKVNENAVGEIKNNSTYTLGAGSENYSNLIAFKPEENLIEITKTAETETYYPNGEMVYNVVIENTGNSIVNDISFEDALNKTKVLLADGTNGDPFDSSTVTGEIVSGETSITTTHPNVSVNAIGKVTSTTFDIKKGEKITFQIKGTVNENVVGDIKNTASYILDGTTTDGDEVTTESEKATIALTKEALVDDDLKGYIPGEKIKYKITIENTGKGFGDNINITDEISTIMVDTVDGSAVAFSENDWEWTKETEELPNVIQNLVPLRGKDLDINVDIESGKTLTLYVEGTVNPDAYGDIINTVTGKNGEDVIPPASATFIPSRSDVVMTHTVDKDVYVPGDYLTYTVTLENEGPGPANGVDFEDNLKDIIVKTTNNDEAAFDLSTIEIVSSSIDPEVTQLEPLKLEDGILTSYIENMPKGGTVTYVFKGKIRDDAVGEIINNASFEYTDNDGTDKADNIEVETKPTNAEITIVKEVDTEEYIAGKDLTYTVTLENEGTGNAKNIELTDKLSEIETEYVDGTTGNVFDSWKITHIITKNSTLVTDVTTVSSYDEVADLDALVIDMAPSDKIEFTIVGKTNAKVKEGAVNTASFEYENNDGTLEKGEATTKESLPLLNDGELLLTKTAMKEEVEQGEFVEYEIIVRNVGETYFYNFFVEDKIPSGFEYVQGTTEMTRDGSDETFDTDDDILVTGEPVVGRTVNFSKVNLAPGESLKIAYLLKVSIGTTFGEYKNTAYALIDGELVSNEDSAIVTVIPDELFDTATIIGKVFEDINGDGYQGLATAKNIKIKGGITKDYIPNSLTVEKNNVKLKLNEKTNSLVNGITVDKLNGISKNKVIEKNDKLTLRFLSKSKDWSPVEISTKAGTNILIDKFGNIKTVYTKDKKKGLSQENLLVTRNTYKSKKKNIYLHEVKIENIGVYEEGIPGVRLIVLDGVVVETDEFGRYHVPDKWVLDKKGENFLVKVDKASIPDGMEIITENPLVRRISPNGLNKFNFSLKEKEVK